MSELRRLGDILNFDSEIKTGDQRVIRAYDNLGIKILFGDETFGLKEFYISSGVEKPAVFSDFKAKVEKVGDYESSLIDKILHPLSPVVCVKGRMGSGKTTTIKYVLENFIECIDCEPDADNLKGLILTIDFKKAVSHEGSLDVNLHDLMSIICKQLWNRCSYYLDLKMELDLFWKHLLDINDQDHDGFVEDVVGGILNSHPHLRRVLNIDNEELMKRERIREDIKSGDIEWYLKYLILIWRYLVQTRFSANQGCAVIVLDNLDSLSTDLQSNLIKIIIKSAHAQGPTFVLVVRPETFDRHGLNDELIDVIAHEGPEPYYVVSDRLTRFLDSPEKYFRSVPSLNTEERNFIHQFLSRIVPKLRKDKSYQHFIKAIAGKSVRNALVLTQGLFGLSVGEMKKRDLTVHYITRAMIRYGSRQYKTSDNKRVTNPFDVGGEIDGRLLIKIRILEYVAGHGGSCSEPNIITTFMMFGFQDSLVSQALVELLHTECQLLASNGFDVFHTLPGNDQEIVSITEVGLGYIDYLIYNIDFIQEIMVDARVNAKFHLPPLYNDSLSSKMFTLITFLRELHLEDVQEVKSFMSRVTSNYGKIFKPQLLTLGIIRKTYDSSRRLLEFQTRKKPALKEEYEEILDMFEKLVTEARNNNIALFGVDEEIPSEPE